MLAARFCEFSQTGAVGAEVAAVQPCFLEEPFDAVPPRLSAGPQAVENRRNLLAEARLALAIKLGLACM